MQWFCCSQCAASAPSLSATHSDVVLLGVLRQPKGEHSGIRLLGRWLIQDQQAKVIRFAIRTRNLQINRDPVLYRSPELGKLGYFVRNLPAIEKSDPKRKW